MKKRKLYPKEFKARVALEAIKEVKTIAELSAEYEIHSNMFTLLKYFEFKKEGFYAAFPGGLQRKPAWPS